MKPPSIRKLRSVSDTRRRERGVTMVLVAIAMVAIIAMAALSIDIINLYLVREEAQRSADAAALAAARVISISGLTGDPGNLAPSWQLICGGTLSAATAAAKAVAMQDPVGGTVANTVTVEYSDGGAPTADCSTLTAGGPFSVNPMVTVQVTRNNLPSFFSRIWGSAGRTVSATATAEVFNPSASDAVGASAGSVTPVLPGCVKPWVVPNLDPLPPNPSSGIYCSQPGGTGCNPLVITSNGAIQHPGISLGGTGINGVIGETFWLTPDCTNNPTSCNLAVPPRANATTVGSFQPRPAPNLTYVPGQVGNQVIAIPSCSQSDPYEEAIEGCDAPTNYQCGVQNANVVDMSTNPGAGPTTNGVQCLIHQGDTGNLTSSSGQDYFNPFMAPAAYPFQILGGDNNPLGAGVKSNPISSSNSIVSLPIYDNNAVPTIGSGTTNVTFVGFLQVFVNAVDAKGNVNVTVLNVAGCGNGNTVAVNSNVVTGTSPVPIRLITPP